VSAYGWGSEKTEDEREDFWKTLSECVNGFEQSETIIIMGDLNRQVGEIEVEEVIGRFCVPEVNWAGRIQRLV
jgi:exonuclease III